MTPIVGEVIPNKTLTYVPECGQTGGYMNPEFLLAAFLIAVGLSAAGASTHFYQGFWQQPAILRFDGASTLGMLGHLTMSFVCGPYIMLRMGLNANEDGAISLTNVLVGAAVALGWAFITGMLFVGSFVAVFG